MTSDILKRAAEAVEGVTPGPWRNEIRYSFIAHDNTWHVLWDVPNSTGVSLVSDTGGNTASCKNDARFIAASRTLIPDMAAAIAERDAEHARLTARAEAAEAMVAGVAGMVSIIEGIDGAMNHGVWRDERGMRLKDTPEWARLYVAYAAHAAMKEGR